MRAVSNLWRLSVGKKILMALAGFGLLAFVLGHLAGNLKLFLGAESFNHYAAWLRVAGSPLLPPGVLLWAARIGLIAIVALHVWLAWDLYLTSDRARPLRYRVNDTSLVDSRLSLTMRWGGVAIGLFILVHLAHLTWGWLYPSEFVHGDAYQNVIAGFQHLWLSVLYMAAVAALAMHLYHGVWSGLQTLGLNSPRYNQLRRPLASAVAAIVLLGNWSLPLAVMLGVVK